jgi:hypothetical protein
MIWFPKGNLIHPSLHPIELITKNVIKKDQTWKKRNSIVTIAIKWVTAS